MSEGTAVSVFRTDIFIDGWSRLFRNVVKFQSHYWEFTYQKTVMFGVNCFV